MIDQQQPALTGCSLPQMIADAPKRRSDVSVREVDGETIILDRRGEMIHQLNCTASYIWKCCDGVSTLDDISAQLAAAFDVDVQTAVHDVTLLVLRLRQLHLLELASDR